MVIKILALLFLFCLVFIIDLHFIFPIAIIILLILNSMQKELKRKG